MPRDVGTFNSTDQAYGVIAGVFTVMWALKMHIESCVRMHDDSFGFELPFMHLTDTFIRLAHSRFVFCEFMHSLRIEPMTLVLLFIKVKKLLRASSVDMACLNGLAVSNHFWHKCMFHRLFTVTIQFCCSCQSLRGYEKWQKCRRRARQKPC